jgi:hypothetical protein
MGDIINLRRARKARERAADRVAAAARAALHGESKALGRARTALDALDARRLDGARLVPPQPGERRDTDE